MVEVAAPDDGTPSPRTLEEPEEEERRAMHPEDSSPDARDVDPSCCVQVAVRVRPLLALEGDDENCVQVLKSYSGNGHATAIQVGGPAGPQFTFDQVFSMASDQIQVYQSRVAPLITSCLDGYNATILAYGQTGSGVRLSRLSVVSLKKDLFSYFSILLWYHSLENTYDHGAKSNHGRVTR